MARSSHASYMSPEQARGEPVDARADVWAFGCVLFEMLAGRRAFDGRTATDVLAAVVKDEPGWDALPPSTPPNVRELVHRCLTKTPAAPGWDGSGFGGPRGVRDGWEGVGRHARDLGVSASGTRGRTRRGRQVAAAALIVARWRWSPPASGTSRPASPRARRSQSIAVLPLTNVSGNPDDQSSPTDDRRADRQPGEHRGAEGDSRTSVMAYRGSRKPLREVARELKVDAIVEAPRCDPATACGSPRS